MLDDLRYALRTLRRSPGFAGVAILSLGLGIGANTAIFQLFDAVRLRSLPVADPQRLVMLDFADSTHQRGSRSTAYPALTNPQWERLRDTEDVFSGMLAWWDNDFGLSQGGEERLARGMFVSGDFFRVLGIPALRGRVFTSAEDRRGCGLPGAVISYAFWQREFAGDPSVIGRRLPLNYQSVEIIGVTPAGFSGLEVGRAFDVAVPICSQDALWTEKSWLDQGTYWWLTVMGRLKPGESLATVNARLQVISPGLFRATLPANYPPVSVADYLKLKLTAVPAATGVSLLRRDYIDPLVLLLATAGLVLLIACANLANLMLARATAREHEIAVRLVMGASRARLIRHAIAESLLLAAAGAAFGLYLSGSMAGFLVALLATQGDPLFLDLSPDRTVLVFTIALAVLTCLLFGLVPAFRATRAAAGDALRGRGRSVAGSRERFGLRQALVVSQVALSLVLLFGALLFSGSLRNLMSVNAGFQKNGVLIANVDFRRLPMRQSEQRIAFKQALLDKLRALPAVDAAGEARILPLSGNSSGNKVWLDGADPGHGFLVLFNWISDGYFKSMAMPLLAGRDFDRHDSISSPRVAIVNQSFVRVMGLAGNPIGRRFRRETTPDSPELAFEIVGLVPDSKYIDLREQFRPIAFISVDQESDIPIPPDGQFLIRSSAPFSDLVAQTRNAIASASPEITMSFRSFAGTVAEGLLRERLMATLSSFFGALAALIAALGLYGVMSYLVARRTHEIGIRMALGAKPGDIAGLIMRQSTTLLIIGVAIGALLSLAAARAVRTLLFGLQPYDAATLFFAGLLLVAIASGAAYLPARRAAHLEPTAALREE